MKKLKKGQIVYFRELYTGDIVKAVVLGRITVVAEAKAYPDGSSGDFKDVKREEYQVESREGIRYSFSRENLYLNPKPLLN